MSESGHSVRTLWYPIFGVYFALVFVVLAPLILVLVAIVPRLRARRAIASMGARSVFLLTGMGPDVDGRRHLPDGACVVVANHASYLDGIILCAVLPPRFAFVIKNEMQRVPLAHFLLRRIGAEFVERHNAGGSVRDARRILRKAEHGQSLAFFPEGTFHAEPGLRRFRSGAFAAAARTGAPIVPAVIHGSRSALPASRLLPRPARISVTLLAPISASDHPAASLAVLSRQRILEVLDEPDLFRSESG